MHSIKILKPCHQDWNQMVPTPTGAFCTACSKEVVDFTNMPDAEVTAYLRNRAGEKLCGKFKETQIDRIRIQIPLTLFRAGTAGWKKFLAVMLLAFGSMLFGCEVSTDQPIQAKKMAQAQAASAVKNAKYPPEKVWLGGLDFSGATCYSPVAELFDTSLPVGVMVNNHEDCFNLPASTTDSLPDFNDSTAPLSKYRPDSTNRISPKKDSIIPTKPGTDSAGCDNEHFY